MFTLDAPHGAGGVFFSWQRASGGYLATTGYDQGPNSIEKYWLEFQLEKSLEFFA